MYASTCLDRGKAYLLQKKYDKAVRSFNTALELQPDDPEIYNKLGLTLIESNRDLEQGISHARKSLEGL